MASKAATTYKILTAVGIFILSFVFAYSPFWVKSLKRNTKLIGAANSFAGGIFLCAGLIHTIPDAIFQWNLTLKKDSHAGESHSKEEEAHGHSEDFPWVTLATLSSFCVILFVDRVLIKHSHHHDHDHDLEHSSSQVRSSEQRDSNQTLGDSPAQQPLAVASINSPSNIALQPNEGEALVQAVETTHIKQASPEARVDPPHSAQTKQTASGSKFGPYALVFAMGVHAFFEGLALGLMKQLGGYLGFLAAIVFHKWAESLAIGIAFLRAKSGVANRVFGITLFSLLTPLGVVLGLLLLESDLKVTAILLGVSSGAFIYVAIAEIVHEEFSKKVGLYWRYLAFLVGVGLMVVTWVVERAGHESAEEKDH